MIPRKRGDSRQGVAVDSSCAGLQLTTAQKPRRKGER
jgi:hypothetical protein